MNFFKIKKLKDYALSVLLLSFAISLGSTMTACKKKKEGSLGSSANMTEVWVLTKIACETNYQYKKPQTENSEAESQLPQMARKTLQNLLQSRNRHYESMCGALIDVIEKVFPRNSNTQEIQAQQAESFMTAFNSMISNNFNSHFHIQVSSHLEQISQDLERPMIMEWALVFNGNRGSLELTLDRQSNLRPELYLELASIILTRNENQSNPSTPTTELNLRVNSSYCLEDQELQLSFSLLSNKLKAARREKIAAAHALDQASKAFLKTNKLSDWDNDQASVKSYKQHEEKYRELLNKEYFNK